MIKAIIFDLGRVILDFDYWAPADVLKKICGCSVEEIYDYIFKTELGSLINEGRISPGEFYRRLKERLNFEIDFEEFKRVFCDIFSVNLPLVRFLQQLKKKHKLYLFSNVNEIHGEYIKRRWADILKIFDQYFFSYQMGIKKPASEAFRRVLETSNLSPRECIYIDDLAENVEVARQLGIKSIQYESLAQLKQDLNKILFVNHKLFP